jgi:peptidoglycan/xylan/chitin deacetylase (PgdA/CDA1 family)
MDPQGSEMPTDDWKAPLRHLVAWLLRAATRWSARPVGLVLVYHAVDNRQGDRRRELVPPHALELFNAQVRHAGRAYRVVPARDIVEAVAKRRRGGRVPLAITFDDDLPSHLGFALPALANGGHSATFFLTGAALQEPAEFWWERLQRLATRGLTPDMKRRLAEAAGGDPEPLGDRDWAVALGRAIQQLTPDRQDAVDALLIGLAGPPPADAGLRGPEVRQLVAAGHEIGFHTRRHYRLPTLDGSQLARALREGHHELAVAAGVEPHLLAYPFGRADERVAAAARAEGFSCGFSTVPLAVTAASSPWLLPRVEPSFRSPGHFALQLAEIMRPRPGGSRRGRLERTPAAHVVETREQAAA